MTWNLNALPLILHVEMDRSIMIRLELHIEMERGIMLALKIDLHAESLDYGEVRVHGQSVYSF